MEDAELPDTAIVDLHRIAKPEVIMHVEGEAFRVLDEQDIAEPITAGVELKVGDTIALSPGASVLVAGMMLRGGKLGHAHAFVAETAFRASPNKGDVPKLLQQLEEIERRMNDRLGIDPLAMHEMPKSPCERATSAEFARLNLSPDVARTLPEPVARGLGAVPIFLCDEAVFVAMSSATIAKLRRVMEELGRPVNPHLVEDAVLAELLERAYGRRRAASISPS